MQKKTGDMVRDTWHGFNFDFYTHHIISKTRHNEFIFSFNFGYWNMSNDQYKIVKSFK